VGSASELSGLLLGFVAVPERAEGVEGCCGQLELDGCPLAARMNIRYGEL
jgi:hypothetical protein